MAKAESFDIKDKKSDQRQAEMTKSPEERLSLCLDLMDLHNSLSKDQQSAFQADVEPIEWIELPLKAK